MFPRREHSALRLRANRRAEPDVQASIVNVEPRFEQLNGHDPVEYILAVNVARRNLSAGQRAMARAMLEPEGKVGRPKKGQKSPN
jgi:hypothetical protein